MCQLIHQIIHSTLNAARLILALLILLHSANTLATNIVLNIIDGASSGLNDPAPASPIGGNTGTTIGEQRQIAFNFAADFIETIFDSSVTITIDASFAPLSCTSSSATLGNGGPLTVHHRNSSIPPIPLPESNTWYVGALANAYKGSDLAAQSDMELTFNASIDNNNSCLNNRNWYYGLDGNAPGNDIDFLSTVMHEILHGLGFLTLVDLPTGSEFSSRSGIYSYFLEDHSTAKTWNQMNDAERLASTTDLPDLHWIGSNVQANSGGLTAGIDQGHVRMYAPSTVSTGSSVSHFSTALSPNELMEPVQTGPKASIGLAESLMIDIGWNTFATQPPVVSKPVDMTISNALTTVVDIAVIDNNHTINSLNLTATSSSNSIISNANIVASGSGRLRQLSLTPEAGESGAVIITVNVDDGTSSTNQQFTVNVVSDFPPSINITDPSAAQTYYSAPQFFSATANDSEDGDISNQIQWSSSLDGALGTGNSISPSLNDGLHTITATVTDSLGNTEDSTVAVTVDLFGDADGDGLNNSLEIALGTNPNNADSDNDYASDFDEVNRDGDPNNYTPGIDSDPNNNDTDGDGVLDGLDFEPLNFNDSFNIPATPMLYLLGLFTAICAVAIRARRQANSKE